MRRKKLPKVNQKVLAWIRAYKEYLVVCHRTKNRKERKEAWALAERLSKKAQKAMKAKKIDKHAAGFFWMLKNLHPDLDHIRWDGKEIEMRLGTPESNEPWTASEFKPRSETFRLLAALEEIMRTIG